jgi:putative peptidoglycan lipid II flippase
VIVPAYYSIEDTRTPVKIAIGAMILNIALNVVFIRPLQVGGPALATALSAVFNAAALIVIFSRREGSIGLGSIVRSFARFSVGAAAVGAVALVLINRPGFYYDQPFIQQALALGLTIAACAAAYFGVAYLLRCPEIGEIRSVFLRRRGPTAS